MCSKYVAGIQERILLKDSVFMFLVLKPSNVPVTISPIRLCMGSSNVEVIIALQIADLAQPGNPEGQPSSQ